MLLPLNPPWWWRNVCEVAKINYSIHWIITPAEIGRILCGNSCQFLKWIKGLCLVKVSFTLFVFLGGLIHFCPRFLLFCFCKDVDCCRFFISTALCFFFTRILNCDFLYLLMTSSVLLKMYHRKQNRTDADSAIDRNFGHPRYVQQRNNNNRFGINSNQRTNPPKQQTESESVNWRRCLFRVLFVR